MASSTASSQQLLKTALNATHRASGARMVPFGGWEMPVEYSGIISEHMGVRTRAGLFDVSHMGRVDIIGSQTLSMLQQITCNDVSRLQDGQAQYSALMNEHGGIVDDILVHKVADHHYFLCINAARRDADLAWMRQHTPPGVEVRNLSDESSQIALQGPRALEILQPFTSVDLAQIRYYWFTSGEVSGVPCRIARTGYTGEDGFELYLPVAESERIWKELLSAGSPHETLPCGLGARNTLRLEAGMLLYGHDMDETTTPLESGLGWIAKLGKGSFLGSDVLARQKAEGVPSQLAGFRMLGRPIARDDAPVHHNGQPVGKVTSGSHAPFLKQNIGLARLPATLANPGQKIQIEIRGTMAEAEIVPTPFYKRPKKSAGGEAGT